MTAEPTAAEIEAAARALADPYGHAPESFRPAVSAHIAAGRALTAALPLVEARLREQIAAEIGSMADSSEISDPYDDGYIDGARHAARIALGNP